MTFLKTLIGNRYFQSAVYLVVFVVGILAFILAMPAMKDFDVYVLLVLMLVCAILYYLYRKRKDEYEAEVKAEYEAFLADHEAKIKAGMGSLHDECLTDPCDRHN